LYGTTDDNGQKTNKQSNQEKQITPHEKEEIDERRMDKWWKERNQSKERKSKTDRKSVHDNCRVTNNEGESKTDREKSKTGWESGHEKERKWLDGTTDDKCRESKQ
jgi:hypothetical protein